MGDIQIRSATVADSSLILRFVTELAAYEKSESEVVATEAMIRQSVFGDDSSIHGLICEQGGEAIGFAVYFFNYSTWLGRRGLFLEDLYVSPTRRGMGAGKALLKHLAKIALDNNCGRFEWNVLDWNTPAIDFYHAIGAKAQHQWVTYRLSGRALSDLAASV